MFKDIYLKIRACKNLVFRKESFIYSTGWINSIEKLSPVNKNYEPIPWMNYHFVKFITNRLNSSMDIFEYGSGYSTLYWSKQVNSIITVEYDKEWFNVLHEQLPSNVDCIFNCKINSSEYAKEALNHNMKFDMIIVDGRNRVECLTLAGESLKHDGIFILDDSHLEKYNDAFTHMKKRDFKEITFWGLKPVSYQFASTTIFYRPNNCLNI